MRRYLVEALGSEKSYILFKIQMAVILSVVVSILYTLLKGDWQVLQIVPLLILALSYAELYRRYPKDFWPYFLLFSVIFVLVLLVPLVLRSVSIAPGNPTELIRYAAYIIFAILILLVLLRGMLFKREIRAKVTLADKDTAVIETDVDLLAGIRAGRYVVKNNGAKKGDHVRVSVRKAVFRGAYPYKIIGKVIA